MFTKCKTIKYITCLLYEFIPEKEQRFKLKTKRDSTNDKKYVVRGCAAFYEPFCIKRDPRSRTEIGERDTRLVHVNEATAA